MNKTIYADYAAATPLDQRVASVMRAYESERFYNPSALYLSAQSVRRDIEDARTAIARLMAAKSSEIYFTAGATESCNLAIHGVMSQYPGGKICISAVEHSAVSEPAKDYSPIIAPVDPRGTVMLDTLEEILRDDELVLVSIIYAHNELGTIQPIRKITALIAATRETRRERGITTPLLLHIDAAQAPNYISIDTNRLGIDLMTLNSSKVYGPKQVGLLYVRTGVRLEPIVIGGGQENGLRSGTENVAGIIGFAEALRLSVAMASSESERLETLRSDFIAGIEDIAGLELSANPKKHLPNVVNVNARGLDGERLVMELDEQGILCSTGAACSANAGHGSPSLRAIGLEAEQVDGSIRFSFGRGTTKEHIDVALESLNNIIVKLQKLTV